MFKILEPITTEGQQMRKRLKQQKNKSRSSSSFYFFSDPVGTRTQDPYIKSVLLYQLSYGIITRFLNGTQRYEYPLFCKEFFEKIIPQYIFILFACINYLKIGDDLQVEQAGSKPVGHCVGLATCLVLYPGVR